MRPFIACGLAAITASALLGCTRSMPSNAEETPAASDAPASSSAADQRPAGKKLYDTTADGFAQIDAALAAAKPAGKRVLLQFGAEWCGWCHRLHRLFESDEQIAAALAAHYEVVPIDVDGDHNKAVDEKYGNATQYGLPVLVVLDADGTPLTTQDTAELEEGDAHDPAKVLAFLNAWATAPATQSDTRMQTNAQSPIDP